MNPIVTQSIPLQNVWIKDFWGIHNVNDTLSHKSWRPLCTISYVVNRNWLSLRNRNNNNNRNNKNSEDLDNATNIDPSQNSKNIGIPVSDDETFWFHLVDRILHGIVSSLVYLVMRYTLLHRYHKSTNHENIIIHDNSNNKNNNNNIIPFYSFLISLLFAAHPIHVEAVANSTGRAEVLCTLFYFISFLIYGRIGVGISSLNGSIGCGGSSSGSIGSGGSSSGSSGDGRSNKNKSTILSSIVGVLFMMISTLASMLCKEHGVTAPLMCIIWDALIGTNICIQELWLLLSFFKSDSKRRDDDGDDIQRNNKRTEKKIITKDGIDQSRRNECFLFLLRTLLSIIGCILLSIWRISKNGDSKPDFVCEQNPAACEPNRLYRFFHYSYLWSFNFWLMVYPNWLSPDWSGDSIPLINEHWATDPRFGMVLLTWFAMTALLLHTISSAFTYATPEQNTDYDMEFRRRTILTSCYWILIPFLLSSNLLVHVGFVVADRTLYLPSLGFCHLMLEMLLSIPSLFMVSRSTKHYTERKAGRSTICTGLLYLFVMYMYIWKQRKQTELWSHPVLIWGESYRLNPNSIISGTGELPIVILYKYIHS